MTVVLRTAVVGGTDLAHENANHLADALAGKVKFGRYLRSFDPDAYGGRGRASFTDDMRQAKQFADYAAATEFWKTQSTVKPLRPDGKANRPLNAYNVKAVTDKTSSRSKPLISRDKWQGAILALLDRHGAVFLNDLLPENRPRAQYQTLSLVAAKLEADGKIETIYYWSLIGKPGYKALVKPGHQVEHPDEIARLKAKERLKFDAARGRCAPALQLPNEIREQQTAKQHTLGEFVFPSDSVTGHVVDIKGFWPKLCRAAGITNLRPHDLRHSFASQLVSGGASLPLIGALLGHSDPSTTARYAHLFQDPQRAAAEEVGAAIVAAGKRDGG